MRAENVPFREHCHRGYVTAANADKLRRLYAGKMPPLIPVERVSTRRQAEGGGNALSAGALVALLVLLAAIYHACGGVQ